MDLDSDSESGAEHKFHPTIVLHETEEELALHRDVEETSDAKDPLLEKVDTHSMPFYRGEFEESDLLLDTTGYMRQETAVAGNRSKRSRLATELKGQNGCKWSFVPTNACVDTGATEYTQTSTGKGPARSLRNPLEAWNLFLDEPILAVLVKSTNDHIRRIKNKLPYQHTVDLIELRAWLGLNYLCGVFRNSQHNGPLEELWSAELGNTIFRTTMSVKRFVFLTEHLQLSMGNAKEKISWELVWEKFVINCRSYYAPSGHCVIYDYVLPTQDEDCPKRFTPPGLRVVTLCDAKTLYMCNAFLATSEVATKLEVLGAVSDIKGTHRTVCLNERYTSIALARSLHDSQLHAVGALPATAKIIPKELLTTTYEQKLYADESTLIAGVNTDVSATGFLLAHGTSLKLDPKKLYWHAQRCCKRFQEMASTYSTVHGTPERITRWSLDFLHAILNYSALNAWILFRLSEKGDPLMEQRDFLRQLGLYLAQQQLKRRLDLKEKLSLAHRLQIAELLGEPTDKILAEAASLATTKVTIPEEKLKVSADVTLASKTIEKRARCRLCRDVKTRTRCQQCLQPLCSRHLIARCLDCTGVKEDTDSKVS